MHIVLLVREIEADVPKQTRNPLSSLRPNIPRPSLRATSVNTHALRSTHYGPAEEEVIPKQESDVKIKPEMLFNQQPMRDVCAPLYLCAFCHVVDNQQTADRISYNSNTKVEKKEEQQAGMQHQAT